VAGNQGCTPGFWKNHTNAWCVSYTPTTPVSTVFNTSACGCNFSTLTFDQALQGEGGNTICDAELILFRAAIAALLNTCGGSGVNYPLGTSAIIAEVNGVLVAPCDRTTILNEASRLDTFNNGRAGCPLGGPATK